MAEEEPLALVPGTLEMLVLKTLSLGAMHGWGIAACLFSCCLVLHSPWRRTCDTLHCKIGAPQAPRKPSQTWFMQLHNSKQYLIVVENAK